MRAIVITIAAPSIPLTAPPCGSPSPPWDLLASSSSCRGPTFELTRQAAGSFAMVEGRISNQFGQSDLIIEGCGFLMLFRIYGQPIPNTNASRMRDVLAQRCAGRQFG